jgi:hypothetical protein
MVSAIMDGEFPTWVLSLVLIGGKYGHSASIVLLFDRVRLWLTKWM